MVIKDSHENPTTPLNKIVAKIQTINPSTIASEVIIKNFRIILSKV
jgi:hypothetical protein